MLAIQFTKKLYLKKSIIGKLMYPYLNAPTNLQERMYGGLSLGQGPCIFFFSHLFHDILTN